MECEAVSTPNTTPLPQVGKVNDCFPIVPLDPLDPNVKDNKSEMII